MDFRIADTFTDSLARLTGDEQKAVKTTAFDLQMNPVSSGMSLHKLDRAKDKNFWSVRVNADIRLIVHKSANSLLLCYVDHHDRAYHWAERRKLETHPTTGAAQLVELREQVRDIVVPRYVESAAVPVASQAMPAAKTPLFAATPMETLLAYGVPAEWLEDVRQADEDSLLALAVHLPAEASEALLQLATGGTPIAPRIASKGADPFEHPDAQRRFRVMGDVEELERALAYPWEKWTTFLHPDQRQWVERDYNGPARISGSAGTGKTIVALHRAVHLAKQNPDARVLLTTFSETLANALRGKLRRLIGDQPRLGDRLEVHALPAIAARLYERHVGKARLADLELVKDFLGEARRAAGASAQKFSDGFLMAEWTELVDAWQLKNWEAYRDVKRLGRKSRLSEAQRLALWGVFEGLMERLKREGVMTPAEMFTRLAEALRGAKNPVFDFVVVDEAQDLSVPDLKVLVELASSEGVIRPNALFFAGDLGQRIFQAPFSWKGLGVDLRGRSRTLHINYRTTHQIRSSADRLMSGSISDLDGTVDERAGTVSVLNGPAPIVKVFQTAGDEMSAVANWLKEQSVAGATNHEIAVLVRSANEHNRAKGALDKAGIPFKVLDGKVETTHGQASVCAMHLAKGLEFRVVAVMACDDEVVPSQERIEGVSDQADLDEVYATERHLLYVACTRARDQLMVSAVSPASEFLADLAT